MTRKRVADGRERLLRDLRRRCFGRFRYRGFDALVARLPTVIPPPPAVKAKLEEGPPTRFYPIEGGYLVRWPHKGGPAPGPEFSVEAGGWDHEHCDGCNRSILVGGTCWCTLRGSFYQLCPYCYRRLTQISRVELI